MSLVTRFAFFLGGLATLAASPALSKGIVVRFLPNPPEDSVVTYRVLRADGPGLAPVPVGDVPAAVSRDTFAFADSSALKGRPYLYSIIGLDAGGGISDPSESTAVATPILGLPDTLQGGAQGARWTLALGADPLAGTCPLALSLADSSRFLLRYDSAARQIVFTARGGALSGQVVVRATYFGKFTDQRTLWLSMETTALRGGGASVRAWAIPATWSPSMGTLRLRGPERSAGLGIAGTWSLLTARGETVAVLPLPGNGSETAWNGRDPRGGEVGPASYLWAVRATGGALLRSGSLRILP
jgi:hypothetical protein